jgi:para-nitrobenzyl esterase
MLMLLLASCEHAQPTPLPSATTTGHALVEGEIATDHGVVRGVRQGETWAFKGIPYAAPPVGDRRWRPPEDAAPWQGVRDGAGFGPVCPQTTASADPAGTVMGSEDCLMLNVWMPASHPKGPLPVLVWAHGGFNTWGSASVRHNGTYVYDGAALASLGAVVVTINYRIGVLGFLALPSLTAESSHHSSGNYGLLDQIAALEWVHRNVAAFGGDPDRVLLFGQSAGGIDTLSLITSPLAKDLFSRAVVMSGPPPAMHLERAEVEGARVPQALGCTGADADVLACLRSKSAEALVAAAPETYEGNGIRYAVNVDGWVLPELPLTRIAAGRHNMMPVVVGTTADEMSTMMSLFEPEPVKDATHFRAALARLFPSVDPDALARVYSPEEGSFDHALIDATSDAFFQCPARWVMRALAHGQHEPVWRYLFSYRYAEGPWAPLGAGHGIDLFFVFHNFTHPPQDDAGRRLADAMALSWVHFAATGTPQVEGAGALPWARYEPDADNYLDLGPEPKVLTGVRTLQCNLWDTPSPTPPKELSPRSAATP